MDIAGDADQIGGYVRHNATEDPDLAGVHFDMGMSIREQTAAILGYLEESEKQLHYALTS